MTYKWYVTGACNVDDNDWICNSNIIFQEFLEISRKCVCNVDNQELNVINSMTHFGTSYDEYFMSLSNSKWEISCGTQKDEFKLNNIFSCMYCGEMQKYLNFYNFNFNHETV